MALLHIHFFSGVLGMSTAMDVLLPETESGPVKTLYLLHGTGEDHTAWQRTTRVEQYAAECGAAVILPEGYSSFWTNAAVGQRFHTFLVRELPNICRGFFPQLSARREDTGIAGITSGGYGALLAALRAPEVFSFAAALDAPADIASLGSEDAPYPGYYTDIFGSEEVRCGSYHDLYAAADACPAARSPQMILNDIGLHQHMKRIGLRTALCHETDRDAWIRGQLGLCCRKGVSAWH